MRVLTMLRHTQCFSQGERGRLMTDLGKVEEQALPSTR